MKHKVAVLVENNPGVLAKVANLFSRRGYNIDSLVVSDTEDKAISRMTIVVDGDERTIEQVTKQLHKLVDVIKVNDLTVRKAKKSKTTHPKVKKTSLRPIYLWDCVPSPISPSSQSPECQRAVGISKLLQFWIHHQLPR